MQDLRADILRNATDLTPKSFPVLTTAERDRRIEAARKFMREQGLVAVLGLGTGNPFLLQAYFGNEYDGYMVVPFDAPPTHIRRGGGPFSAQPDFDNKRWGFKPWTADTRIVMDPVAALAQVIEERGLTGKKVGVAGIDSASMVGGQVADSEKVALKKVLSAVEWVDISVPFGIQVMAPRSAEELVLVRHAAQVAENAASALVAESRVGARESDIQAAVYNALIRGGADTSQLALILTVKGDEVAFMGGRKWYLPAEPIHSLVEGDVVLAEIFAVYGGLDCQAQISVAIGEPHRDVQKAWDVARRAFDAGVEAIRPGVTFDSVWQAMRKVILDAGAWSWTPIAHTLCPTFLTGELYSGLADADVDPAIKQPAFFPAPHDAVLQEGMLLAIEPGAAFGYRKAMCGSTVLVTKDGAEPLTKVSYEKLHVRA